LLQSDSAQADRNIDETRSDVHLQLSLVLLCRYFQGLFDAAVDAAKSNGAYNKGVQFVAQGAKLEPFKTIWRHPQASGGQVRVASNFALAALCGLYSCSCMVLQLPVCTPCSCNR
jgi:hypothetical protein